VNGEFPLVTGYIQGPIQFNQQRLCNRKIKTDPWGVHRTWEMEPPVDKIYDILYNERI